MRCPQGCTNWQTKVVDSRPVYDDGSIKRRRVCEECGHKFVSREVLDDATIERKKLAEAKVILTSAIAALNQMIGGWHAKEW